MKKRTPVYLGILAGSVVVMGVVMLWPTLDILAGWDFAFLAAIIGFFLAVSQLLKRPADEWRELWYRVGPTVAKLFFAVSLIVFIGTIILICLPEKWQILSSLARNMIMGWALIVLWVSSWSLTPK